MGSRRCFLCWPLLLVTLSGCGSRSESQPETPEKLASSGEVQQAESPSPPPAGGGFTQLLDPDQWHLAHWNTNQLDEPLPPDQAELKKTKQGLQVTVHDRLGQTYVGLKKELIDDFEVKFRINQPSVNELTQDGLARPTPFGGRIGFVGIHGNPIYRSTLRRDKDVRETYDVVVRASQRRVAIWVNGKRSSVHSRGQAAAGHVFIQLPSPTRIEILDCEVRENLKPDPSLLADSFSSGPSSVSSSAMRPPKTFPGPMFPGPMSPHPMFPGSGPFPGTAPGSGLGGPPPAPLRRPALRSAGDWMATSTGNAQLDSRIVQDLQLEQQADGLRFTKTDASGGFWLLQEIEPRADFELTLRLTIPSQESLAGVATFSALALGIHPAAAEHGSGVTIPAPSPLPAAERDVAVAFRREDGRLQISVDGTMTAGSADSAGAALIGFYALGGIHFWIHDVELVTSQSPEAAEADLQSPLAGGKRLPAKRVWTERSAQRQTEATFLRLEDNQVHLRMLDGTGVVFPLDGLSSTDQQVVRRLVEQQKLQSFATETRVWTSDVGSTVEARLVGVATTGGEQVVTLERADGSRVPVAIERLSARDREVVEAWIQGGQPDDRP